MSFSASDFIQRQQSHSISKISFDLMLTSTAEYIPYACCALWSFITISENVIRSNRISRVASQNINVLKMSFNSKSTCTSTQEKWNEINCIHDIAVSKFASIIYNFGPIWFGQNFYFLCRSFHLDYMKMKAETLWKKINLSWS